MVVLKRTQEEVWINDFNLGCLKHWQRNIDCQIGLGPAMLSYISFYAVKSAEEMPVWPEVQKIVKDCEEGKLHKFKGLRQIAMKLLNHRQMSACKSTAVLCRIPLRRCSREVVFINTCKPDVRYRLMKQEKDKIVGYYRKTTLNVMLNDLMTWKNYHWVNLWHGISRITK